MYVTCHEVEVTTNAAGAAEAFTKELTGQLLNIIYVKPASDGLDTADFTITGEKSGLSLWTETGVNASKTVAPAQPLHNLAGVARLYAALGEEQAGPIYLAYERIKLAIASGGNAKKGSFKIYVLGPN